MKSNRSAFLMNMAPVLVFYVVNHFYGLRPAVVTTILFTVFEIVRFKIRKEPLNKLFIFSVTLTLIFSTLDLIFAKGLFVRLEPVVTNLVTAGLCGYMVYAPGMLLESAVPEEKRQLFKDPDRLFVFRAALWVWVLFFIGKSIVYLEYNMTHTIEQGLIFRTAFGNGSLVVMLGASFATVKFSPALFRRLKMLPSQRLRGGELS